jgi:selenocysteine lyase/cysteine desulfurase
MTHNPVDQAGRAPDWQAFRLQMSIAQRWAYLDHAAVSPLPRCSQEAVIAWANQAAESGDVGWMDWDRQVEQLRDMAAGLIGGQREEIALLHSTTEGVNLVAEGFPWQAGDNVVTLADEFPTNQYAWLNLASRGVETRRVPTDEGRVDLDQLAAAFDARTRILTFSWVAYASGWRNDLAAMAEIAHRRGALVFVDAIQALGVFPLDVKQTPIDFLAADGHKWLLGPEGAAIFWLRREHLSRLRPLGLGWHSVAGAHDFTRIELELKPAAERYEGGSQNMVGMLGLHASLGLLQQYGAAAIGQRIVAMTGLACRRLQEAGALIRTRREPGHESGIVSFEVPGRDPQEVRRRCLEQGVVMSCRAGRLRISVHAYNNEEDIERLVESLRKG